MPLCRASVELASRMVVPSVREMPMTRNGAPSTVTSCGSASPVRDWGSSTAAASARWFSVGSKLPMVRVRPVLSTMANRESEFGGPCDSGIFPSRTKASALIESICRAVSCVLPSESRVLNSSESIWSSR